MATPSRSPPSRGSASRLRALVRIRGIDAPELRGGCPSEKALAAAARDQLADLTGPLVVLTDIANDKYAGRVVADVRARDDRDLRLAMLASGLARAYDGEGRGVWCP